MTRRSLLLQTALLVTSLALVEAALQVASHVSPSVDRLFAPPWEVGKALVDDPQLIFRGNPANPEHDEFGYRNRRRPARAEIVTLGDSQSYGPADAAAGWPRRLERDATRTVYNMALPGYGPGQSLLQLDDALSLSPRVVVVAPYFGNDLYDCFELALRHPDLLAPVSPALRDEAMRRESVQPLKMSIEQRYTLFADIPDKGEPAGPPALYQRLKLYGMVRAIRYRLTSRAPASALLSRRFATAAAGIAPAQREFIQAFDDGAWRTLLTPRYRARAVDDRDPRIRAGFEVMRQALLSMAERTRTKGVGLLVVLVPTKEVVVWSRVADPEAYPGLRQLVADETRLRGELTATLEAYGIPYLDLLEVLRAAPGQPYFEDVDGHPNELGHRLIAEAVAGKLKDVPVTAAR